MNNVRLGIGFDNSYPSYTLDIPLQGTGLSGTLGLRYFNFDTAIAAGVTSLSNVSVRVGVTIWCGSWIVSSSDSRIKEDIEDINDDTVLNIILAIEPKTYKYIDKVEKGDKKVLADYDNKTITLPSQPTKVIIKLNDKIKCFGKDNYYESVVIEIIDNLTFKIKQYEREHTTEDIVDTGKPEALKPNTIINDFKYTDNKIFICGTEVDDFHTISKEYIFTLNVCVTQELHRRIISQEERIKELEKKMADILKYLSL